MNLFRGIGLGAIFLSAVVVLIYMIKRRGKFNNNIRGGSDLINSKKGFRLVPEEEEVGILSDSE